MGQKVNPHGFRVGVIKDWDSRWMAKKGQFADFIVEDDKIRKFIKKKHYEAGISRSKSREQQTRFPFLSTPLSPVWLSVRRALAWKL